MDLSLIEQLNALKELRNTVILAHYYTLPEIQEVADFLGDSLELSKKAKSTSAETILFCGVHFMAETAAIISPEKRILIPDASAGCSLADSITAEGINRWREKNPDGVVVTYVNTSAEVKAASDICCTSSNAVRVVESFPKNQKILFTPDCHLGGYLNRITGRKMELWQGNCCVHHLITAEMVRKAHLTHPDADILIHPESHCSDNPEILAQENTFFYSTSGIISHVASSPKNHFIIATEEGLIHRLRELFPDKRFTPISPDVVCREMKKSTLRMVVECLEKEQHVVSVPKEIADKARLAIERMLAL